MTGPISRAGDPARPAPAKQPGEIYAHPRKAAAVLAWLTEQPRDDGDIVASQRTISAGTGIPVPTVRRALRRLLDDGRLVLVEAGTGYPYSSRYRLGGDQPTPSIQPIP